MPKPHYRFQVFLFVSLIVVSLLIPITSDAQIRIHGIRKKPKRLQQTT